MEIYKIMIFALYQWHAVFNILIVSSMKGGTIMSDSKILTTGVLNRNTNTTTAHVELVNLDPDSNRTITVQVIGWIGTPTILDQQTFNLPPNQNTSFLVNVSTVVHYEVRLIVNRDEDVVVNVFGTGANVLANQEGNTVLYSQLIEVELD